MTFQPAVLAAWAPQLAGAVAAGLLSSGHCVGMCGGIVGFLSRPAAMTGRSEPVPLRRSLSYQIGRVATYTTLGALAGAFGGAVVATIPWLGHPAIARLVAAAFFVAVAFYLVGRPALLAPIERLGGRLWRLVEPYGRSLRGRRSCAGALATGAIWGLLPCGLVYSMLVLAASAASSMPASASPPPAFLAGASVMLAFGIGTLPALLLVGAASRGLWSFLRRPAARRFAALCYLAAAVWLVSGSVRAAILPSPGPPAHCATAAPAFPS